MIPKGYLAACHQYWWLGEAYYNSVYQMVGVSSWVQRLWEHTNLLMDFLITNMHLQPCLLLWLHFASTQELRRWEPINSSHRAAKLFNRHGDLVGDILALQILLERLPFYLHLTRWTMFPSLSAQGRGVIEHWSLAPQQRDGPIVKFGVEISS